MKPYPNPALILLAVLFSLVFVGCSSSSTESETEVTIDPYKVTDIIWEWEFHIVTIGRDDDGRPIQEKTGIPDPENYTLILREDNTFSGKADCNEISGTYTNDRGYSFTFGSSTMAFCGEDLLDKQYLDLLSRVIAGGPYGEAFALEAGGSESVRMEFRNGGVAPAQ